MSGITMEPIQRLTKDLKTASVTLSKDEARFLVDCYYQMQDNRIRSAAQIRSMSESGEPHAVLSWYQDQAATLEKQVQRALDAYSASDQLGVWARSHKGVGPVIAAGLLAHVSFEINGERINTASALWRYAGLDPSSEWKKGEKRPWNAELKKLCVFKLGESFVKVSGKDDAFYGRLYAAKKEELRNLNEEGKFAEAAKAKLERFKIGKSTDAYKHYSAGKLPPAHVHARARRWTVKMFLSHYHQVGYWMHYGEQPPKPYVFAVLGHKDVIEPPNAPWR